MRLFRLYNLHMVIKRCVTGLIFLLSFSTFSSGHDAARDARWRDDLRFLATELATKHKNFFFQLKQPEFVKAVARIDARIPQLTDREIQVEMIRLVASARDGHTQVWWKTDAFALMPFSAYRFDDGWYVVRASNAYQRIVGARIVKIGETDIEVAADALKTFVACDNEPCYRDRLSRYFNVADFLYAAGLTRDRQSATFTFVDRTGREFTQAISGFGPAELKDLKLISAFDEKLPQLPLYRRNPELNYWREFIADSKTLYINYRKCAEMESLPFAKFAAETFAFLDSNDVERVVIDLRQNGGGKESIMRPLSVGLHERKKFHERGRVFVVIGRATYSSANNNAYELRRATNALFVGEPTGQKPNHYGEVKTLTLPNSGIQVGYSSNYFKRVDGDPDSVQPDINAALSFSDYLAGRDVVLAAALAYRK